MQSSGRSSLIKMIYPQMNFKIYENVIVIY